MAQKPSATIAVSIAATDAYSAAFSKFRNELAQVQKPLEKMRRDAGIGIPTGRSPFGDVGGMPASFAAAREHAVGLRTAVMGLSPQLAGLGALGTAAGIGAAAVQFAQMGVGLEQVSRMAGVSASGLNSMRGAADQVGVSADAVDSSMVGLNHTLQAAVFGKPEGAAAASMMQHWGIAFGNMRDGAKPTEEVLRRLVPILQQLYQTGHAQAAANVGQAFGMTPEFVRLLAQGNDEIDRMRRQHEALNPWSPENEAAARRYTASMASMSAAAAGLRNTVVTALEPAITGAMNTMTAWASSNSKVEQSLLGIGGAAVTLGGIPFIRWLLMGGGLRLAASPVGVAVGAGLAAGAAGGAMNAPTTDDLGRVTGNAGGAAGEQAWRQNAEATKPPPGWRPGAGYLMQQLFGTRPTTGVNPAATVPNPNSWSGPRPGLGNPGPGSGGAGGPRSPSADTTLPPEARALLDTVAGPESGGRYDVRWGSRTPITDFSRHPNIQEPGPSGPSSAAGRYQMIYGTWQAGDRMAGGNGNFSPAAQDRAAWALAQSEYRRQSGGRDLLADLRDPSQRQRISQVMSGSNLWTSFNPARLQQNMDRYQAQPGAAPSPPQPVPPPPPPPAPVPAAPPAATAPAQAASKLSIDILHSGVPDGVSMRARTEGDAAEIDRIRIARAMPETRGR